MHPNSPTSDPSLDRSTRYEIPEFSVVMPCLNESETLGTCIDKALRSLRENGVAGEVIVADNGSTDGSQDVAREKSARVVDVPVPGYGAALMGGIAAARGKYVVMADADDSYDFGNLTPFIHKLREGHDLVMGSRFKGRIEPGAMPFLHRYLGNPVLSAIGRLFFGSRASDFHCGMRGFSKQAITRLDLKTTGMEFASEMVVKATLLKLKIAEVPITLHPDGRSRPPHLRTWRDGWRHLRFMLLYSPRWLFLYPGLLLMAAGTLLGLWLLPGPRRMINVTLDVHTLLYAAMSVVIGFQAVVFAVFTKIYAISRGLLPADAKADRVFKLLTLEVGLVTGELMLVAGLGGSVYAVAQWGAHDFGTLDYSTAMRVVIPSTVLLVLGCQVVLSSFFLSILRLSR